MRKQITKSSDEKRKLLTEIQQTKWALDSAYSNFENVVDPDLIDCCIYELNAVHKRYKYLLEKAKEVNLTRI